MNMAHPNGFGMAINHDSTLCAVVDDALHCVRVHSLDASGSALSYDHIPGDDVPFFPKHVCFAKRGLDETLLVSSINPCGVVEICTASGVLRRVVTVAAEGDPSRLTQAANPPCVAYEPRHDVIAVTFLCGSGAVQKAAYIIQYATGATIRSIGDEVSRSVAFSADGAHFFTVSNDCVRKLRFSDLELLSHETHETAEHHAEYMFTGVLCSDDGGHITARVQHGRKTSILTTLEYKDAAGETWHEVTVRGMVVALAWLHGNVCCKTYGGKMHVIRNEWLGSLRRAWISTNVAHE